MAEIDNIVLEQLRHIRGDIKKLDSGQAELKHHVLEIRSSLAHSLAKLGREDNQIYTLLAEHGARLERLEKRLDLKD